MSTTDDTEYTTWLAYPEPGFVRTEDVPGIERRMAKRHDEPAVTHMRDLLARGQQAVCVDCGEPFTPAARTRSPRCAGCRAAIQRETRKEKAS